MKYRNNSIQLDKLLFSNRGSVEPCCNQCKTKDCEHVIETHSVSIFGINKTWRVMLKGDEFVLVISCDGFSVD